jgi:hypothetical protein
MTHSPLKTFIAFSTLSILVEVRFAAGTSNSDGALNTVKVNRATYTVDELRLGQITAFSASEARRLTSSESIAAPAPGMRVEGIEDTIRF